MRVVTTVTEVYKFNELTPQAKAKALSLLQDTNLGYDWWGGVYEAAAQCGIKITYFDLDRNRHCKADIVDVDETANYITADYGMTCATYQTAKAFQEEKAKILEASLKDADDNYADEYALDEELDILSYKFKKDICKDYAYMLQKEYEYLGREEAIIESIEANDYDFTVDGKLF